MSPPAAPANTTARHAHILTSFWLAHRYPSLHALTSRASSTAPRPIPTRVEVACPLHSIAPVTHQSFSNRRRVCPPFIPPHTLPDTPLTVCLHRVGRWRNAGCGEQAARARPIGRCFTRLACTQLVRGRLGSKPSLTFPSGHFGWMRWAVTPHPLAWALCCDACVFHATLAAPVRRHV